MKKNLLYLKITFLSILALFIFISCSSSEKLSRKDRLSIKKESKKAENKVAEEVIEVQKVTPKIQKIMVYLGDESIPKWKLVSLKNQNALELYEILPMMRFDEPWKQIYGITGCNKFTAYYVKNNSNLSVSRVTTTDATCDNINESLFLNTFKEVDEINEEGNTLSLFNRGDIVLVFEKM